MGLIKDAETKPLLIKGSEGVVVEFAECCRPIPGDSLLAVFSKGQGIIVHTDHCKKVTQLQNDQESLLNVRWEDQVCGEFLVEIVAEVINERGVLASLAIGVADAGANIQDIKVSEHIGHYSRIVFTISVIDRPHLMQVMRRLRSLKDVSRVYRRRKY
jgi:guanosine-3',5'-bis(diphosphate) 3'-pyrophosphohydrolase